MQKKNGDPIKQMVDFNFGIMKDILDDADNPPGKHMLETLLDIDGYCRNCISKINHPKTEMDIKK